MVDYGAQYTEDVLRGLERRIQSVYAEAERDVQAKADDFVRKFRVKDQKYRTQLAEGKITETQYQSWVRGQVFQNKMWEARTESITKVLANTNRQALAIINGEVNGVFAENANWQSYLLEHGAGVNFGFGFYDEATVNRLLRDNPELLPKKTLNMPKDRQWNQGNITRQITQGIIQGEKLDDIAKRLRNVTDMNKNSSLTNARTAMTGAQNAGRQETINRANKMGLKTRKEWLATLDAHTRVSHQELDGQKVDHDKPFRIGGYSIRYPGDPQAHPSMVYNCRCTMVADLVDYPTENVQRYDNITGKPIASLTYKEWKQSKTTKPNISQVGIGACRSVQEVVDLMNNAQWFTAPCSLDGCDLDSAKSIAAAYEQVFDKYPQLKGKFGPVTAKDLGDSTYAQCWMRSNGRVDVNNRTDFYGKWQSVVDQYDKDVISGWHPYGTTAESVLTHEIGHAVDGLIAKQGVLGGYNAAGEMRFASSLLRNPVMKQCGLTISDSATAVSRYGAKNPQEWFAEAFAEYITSANPRPVATALGKRVEELLKEVK